ncbi:MAG: TadE family protein [Candidatus Limnocylindrales bacterium]
MEFALILPIFAVMVFGLIDVGRMVYVNNAAAEGAREGSRYGSVAARSNTASSRDQVRTWTLGSMSAVPSATVTRDLPA